MNPFLRRSVICLAPVIAAVWIVLWAWFNDRFKLGVDLSGGTILVYEIDPRKKTEEDKPRKTTGEETKGESLDPTVRARADANLLARKLKERIDPTDTYNIVIRPAGGENRVEIILPTGGVERAKRAEQEWEKLLGEMMDKYQAYGVKVDIGRGRIKELAESIQRQVSERIWEDVLFRTEAQLLALGKKANKELDPLKRKRGELFSAIEARYRDRFNAASSAGMLGATGSMSDPAPWSAASAAHGLATQYRLPSAGDDPAQLPPDLIRKDTPAALLELKGKSFKALREEAKNRVEDFSKNKEIDAWFQEQAWKEMLGMVWDKFFVERYGQDPKTADEWARLKDRKAELDNILPDSFEELYGRVEVRGNTLGQAFLNSLEPVMGHGHLAGDSFIPRDEVKEFVVAKYGPSAQDIQKEIQKITLSSGRRKDLSIEEVQRIKDLVSKVGKLEFRILANRDDDKAAIADAIKMINEPDDLQKMKNELEDRQNKGLPPPPPRPGRRLESPLEPYNLNLARGAKSRVTYTWVEIGPQERQQIGLHNNAKNEPGRARTWSYLAAGRRNRAAPIPFDDQETKFLLQGALFFSRVCLDRNLSEEIRNEKKIEYFILTRDPEIDPVTDLPTPDIDGSYLRDAFNQPGNDGRPAVSFVFKPAGGELFGNLTRKNVPSGGSGDEGSLKRHLAIVLDGLIVSAPTINSEIRTHGQISGSFTVREVDQLVSILRAGALPATLKPQPVSESTIGATLGRDTIEAGVWAIGLAFLAVLLFMIAYYRFAGLVASIALLANLLLTVAFMVAVQATFTLPGLAGLVLMLGMAVDANILIYERLREERERGASLPLAIRNGYDRAFGTIIDTHLSSIFTAIVLYIVGNDQLKGFGVTLTVGLIISLFTSLYMTRLIFDLWQVKGWLTKLSMFRLFSRPDIDFMGIRYYWFTATIILTILGLGLFLARGTDGLNIDFNGGTAYGGQLKPGFAQNMKGLRDLLDERRQKELLMAEVEEIADSDGHRFKLSYREAGNQLSEAGTIRLANKAPGSTPQERAENVRQRASVLPDASVEQIFPSKIEEADRTKSRFFNVRTSERERDLVQATLDRLLRDKNDKGEWTEMLRKVKMKPTQNPQNVREWTIQFVDEETTVGASLSFVKTLLTEELLTEFKKTKTADLPFFMDLTGEGQSHDGRYSTAKLSFAPAGASLDPKDVPKIKEALARTADEFNRRPQPERLEVFDSQLAAETRLRAMWAILLSWGAILFYLWFRFGNWTFGLAAVLCLIHDLLFTIGIIAACHYVNHWWPGFLGIEDFKLDLTGVAALLTLVGYSVNDTIVVFDRIREVRGKNPDLTPNMINDSVNQTLSRTILASLTTWLVVLVLYIWGGPGVKLFAFVMVVGVIVGTYSSIYIASPLLLIFGEGARAAAKGRRERQPLAERAPDVRIQPAGP